MQIKQAKPEKRPIPHTIRCHNTVILPKMNSITAYHNDLSHPFSILAQPKLPVEQTVTTFKLSKISFSYKLIPFHPQ